MVSLSVQIQLPQSDIICEQLFRTRLEGLLYDAERDMLAIAKFLVLFSNNVPWVSRNMGKITELNGEFCIS